MEQEMITSVHNPQIKRLHQLLNRKGREASGTFLVEGVHLVEEALRSGAEVKTVVYDRDRGIDPACEAALRVYDGPLKRIAVTEQVLAKLSETKSPQGIVAEVSQHSVNWQAWKRKHEQTGSVFVVLMLDELQDPGNLGTIIRTAEAAGIDGIVVGENSVDLYNGKVLRATMGAIFRLPLFRLPLAAACEELGAMGTRLLVTSVHDGSVAYDEPVYDGRIAIVIGNEGRGVSPEISRLATTHVHIPLYGAAESLNAAVACGIMLYEARRQRKQ
ncbi:TrmH family RNA methyltransferase [Brevibacillus fluminis]|uniref:TrmH family RNA methyltransferase n=1 Tax=Brevibacillus fluminis TaxID=511487 RepID=UPI003F8A5FAF